MGFCTKCGKPLKDGEICSCQQQTPQMTARGCLCPAEKIPAQGHRPLLFRQCG